MQKQRTRDHFSNRWGFILACIGSAVGMGNLWRFPIMISTWGGLTFLIPYALSVILIASTGVIGEFALGRITRSGPMGAFSTCARQRWGEKAAQGSKAVGLIPVLGSMAMAIGYTVIMGWIFRYAYLALTGKLYHMGLDMPTIGARFEETASHNALWIVVAISVALLIMALGVARGIERANRLMMPLLFFLLLGLAIYIAFLPGSSRGYRYLLTLNPKGLLNPYLWLYAFGQAFFSLSIAGSGSVIYGSYLPEGEDLPASARNVALFDTLAALLAASVILPAMALAGADVSSGGPGLMFIHLVRVLNSMPAGFLLGPIFYVAVLFAGLSSIINLYEAPVATLQEQLGLSRKWASLCILLPGGLVAILIQSITSQWMDAVSIYVCPLGALLAAVFFCWIAQSSFVLKAVNQGRKRPLGLPFFYLTKYLYCALCLLALIAGALLGGIG